MKIVFISDTHGQHDLIDLPPGDLLIHGGDFANSREMPIGEYTSFERWWREQKFKYKVFIAGNHDGLFDHNPHVARSLFNKVADGVYLENSMVEIEGIKIWGTPWVNQWRNLIWAFADDEAGLLRRFSHIPEDIDILISHGPAYGILDKNESGVPSGSKCLDLIIKNIKPKYVLSGHIHESYGVHKEDGITYMNGSICGINGKMAENKPIVFEYEVE